ncbi:DUF4012 domain-containing protein [Jatrophihabitans sp.]|uniref:DUF4012 domain-containing protein n=1 Tax=Jatrophihabitans sp. TaxID=1932789 RepID=UPI0030C69CCE|nr:hypothetical protein [Jatrophihabitans sp.]
MGILWIVVTGIVARNDAIAIRTRLHDVQVLVAAGDVQGAEQVAADIPALAKRAHRLTTGPAWFLGSEIPYFGTPLEIARGTTAATDELGSQGVSVLLKVILKLDPAKLRTNGHTIDLAPLAAAAPQLKTVAHVVDHAVKRLDGVPSSSWLTPVDSVHATMQTLLTSVDGYVNAAARASDVLPTMLGDDGPKRYFIGLQNEAEMRGTGGLPGAFAILVADHGKLTFTHFESDTALLPKATNQLVKTGLDFGTNYDLAYGTSNPTSLYVNSNVSPNFPYAAKIWAAMWEKQSGEHVDGAMAVDPGVLANLLAATGPVTTPSGVPLAGDSVVSLVEQKEYAIFNNNTARKDFLVSVLKSVADTAISGRPTAPALVRALTNSAKAHRVFVWSSDAAVEKVIGQTDYAGAIPTTSTRPFVGLVMNNAAAGKLDYYLNRSVTYQSTGCGSTRDVEVTIELKNGAPTSGLPSYVTDRLDADHPADVKPGDNRAIVDYYATPGAQLASAQINGAAATANVLSELGHPVYRLDLEMPRQTISTIKLHLVEPASKGSVDVWYQPGVNPESVTVDAQTCH